MKMGSKQKHDPNNFSQKDQSKMAKIPGSDNPANYRKESLGLVGLLGGNIASFGKQVIKAVRYKPWVVKGKKYGDIDRLTGKVTNKFNKSVKDKPAYGIDQYKYAKTKGRKAVEKIKNRK